MSEKMEPFVEDVIAAAYDDTLTVEERAGLRGALDAVPRTFYENARSVANLQGMGREKAEAEAKEALAEADRLRATLDMIAADCVLVPDSERNETVRWVARTACAVLYAEDDDR